jgi:hypothetical protein
MKKSQYFLLGLCISEFILIALTMVMFFNMVTSIEFYDKHYYISPQLFFITMIGLLVTVLTLSFYVFVRKVLKFFAFNYLYKEDANDSQVIKEYTMKFLSFLYQIVIAWVFMIVMVILRNFESFFY